MGGVRLGEKQSRRRRQGVTPQEGWAPAPRLRTSGTSALEGSGADEAGRGLGGGEGHELNGAPDGHCDPHSNQEAI